MKALLCLISILPIIYAAEGNYKGHKVVRFNFTKPHHLDTANEIFGEDADYWRGPSHRFPTDVLLSPETAERAIGHFSQMGVKHEVLNHDVQKSLDFVESEIARHRKRRDTEEESAKVVGTFARYADIVAWVDSLPAQYPNLISVEDIGNSFEGRPMKMMRIGNKANTNKVKVFMESTIHAREWLAAATIIWITNEFLTKYGSDADIKNALDKVEWNFVPVGNPDGYEFSHTNQRMWRKTRSRYSITQTCYGVDPNRNYDYFWGGEGTSASQCSDIYKGPNAFSEVEVKNLRDQVLRLKPKLYAAVHTYVPCAIYPYAYTSSQIITPPNVAEHHNVAMRFATAVNRVNGQRFAYGNTVEVLSAGAGGSDDWAVGVKAADLAYTFELRAGCQGGFIACVSDITPSGREVLAGFVEISKIIA